MADTFDPRLLLDSSAMLGVGLRIWPDPVLREKALPCQHDGSAVHTQLYMKLALKMIEVLESKPEGIGIAATQVGVLARAITLDTQALSLSLPGVQGRYLTLLNPTLSRAHDLAGRTELRQESCLSLPGVVGAVLRSRSIGLDCLSLDGQREHLDLNDLAARCVLHELDHLEGILITDRMTPRWKKHAKWQMKKLEQKAEGARSG